MSASRSAVKVNIGGEEFTVRSELSPEYTQEVAAYFDRILRDIRSSLPTMEAHKVAILAGLAITDEMFQGRRGDRDQADRITALVEEFARLAPARRGGAGPADAG
jgi:cell division protein ZapA (FtsZ GTPase activity inhibitor)